MKFKTCVFSLLKAVTLGIIISSVMLGCKSSPEDEADKKYQDDKVEEAIVLYEKAINEGSKTAINKLALLYANEHKPEKAKEFYIKSFNQGDKEAAQYLSNISLRDGKNKDVIRYAKSLVDNGDTALVYALGSAYFNEKEYDNAIKYLSIGNKSVYVKDVLGSAYYAKGDLKNAEIQWREAVDNYKSGAINSYHKLLKLYQEQNRDADYKAYEGKY